MSKFLVNGDDISLGYGMPEAILEARFLVDSAFHKHLPAAVSPEHIVFLTLAEAATDEPVHCSALPGPSFVQMTISRTIIQVPAGKSQYRHSDEGSQQKLTQPAEAGADGSQQKPAPTAAGRGRR